MLMPFLPPKRSPAHPEQGLTLIECLVAIIMVALVAGSIAPVLVISLASRVNSQKSEQALGLAQSEVDRTRTLVAQGGYTTANLPPLGSTASGAVEENAQISSVLGPNLSVTDPTNFAYARPVDVNGDGQNDFLVQQFRSQGFTSSGIPVAFTLGIRVYDIDVTGTGNLKTEKDNQDRAASLGLTGGTGPRSQYPLAVLYSTIAVGDKDGSLCDMIRYFNSQQAAPASNASLALPPTCQ
ncbi:MAG: type II secretion system protein [Leptolyngbya sp.]|nr:type II secretion system protein [Leptolyngbya sp.]